MNGHAASARNFASVSLGVAIAFALSSCSISLPVWARLTSDGQMSVAHCYSRTVDRYEFQLRADKDETILSTSSAAGPETVIEAGEIVDLNDVAPGWTYGDPLDLSLDWESYWVEAFYGDKQVSIEFIDRADLPDDQWHQLGHESGNTECPTPDFG